ncbi:VWA domain-containing protein [Bacillaceae bacterium]
MQEAIMQQIVLITDGCSNTGFDPAAAAALARQRGIVVNVIGVVDAEPFGVQGEEEVRRIAEAGGGISRVVYPSRLAQTVQMVTRQAATRTIHQLVDRALWERLGVRSLQELTPGQREKVVEIVEEVCDTGMLRVALLIDTSGSMKNKLAAVCEAINDFSISLRSRSGRSEMTCLTFPGKRRVVEQRIAWTSEVEAAVALRSDLQVSGATPTGTAILETLAYFRPGAPEPLVGGYFRDYVF